jgi:hypothetical protein
MREGEGWSVCGAPLGLGREHRYLGRCSHTDIREVVQFGFMYGATFGRMLEIGFISAFLI